MQEVASGYGLIEAPVWDDDAGLYFSDVTGGGARLLTLDGSIETVIPKRRGIGGMALHADGGLVAGGRDIVHVSPGEPPVSTTLLSSAAIDGAIGFNDLTTDSLGRVYVGSLGFRVFGGEPPRPGHLHVIDLDGAMRTLSDGIMLTNGLGFSPDGSRLYHSDSRSNLVRVYDVLADGSVSAWRTFADFGSGVPDGLAVASDGSVWVADARGGRVAVFEASGAHRADIPVPRPMVTSVCFGGDLRDLYIVTGSDGSDREDAGTLYRLRTDVAGLPRPKARVKI
jgi:D-xylonolactonase